MNHELIAHAFKYNIPELKYPWRRKDEVLIHHPKNIGEFVKCEAEYFKFDYYKDGWAYYKCL